MSQSSRGVCPAATLSAGKKCMAGQAPIDISAIAPTMGSGKPMPPYCSGRPMAIQPPSAISFQALWKDWGTITFPASKATSFPIGRFTGGGDHLLGQGLSGIQYRAELVSTQAGVAIQRPQGHQIKLFEEHKIQIASIDEIVGHDLARYSGLGTERTRGTPLCAYPPHRGPPSPRDFVFSTSVLCRKSSEQPKRRENNARRSGFPADRGRCRPVRARHSSSLPSWPLPATGSWGPRGWEIESRPRATHSSASFLSASEHPQLCKCSWGHPFCDR